MILVKHWNYLLLGRTALPCTERIRQQTQDLL